MGWEPMVWPGPPGDDAVMSGLHRSVAAVLDLVLPDRCATCPAARGPLCPRCRQEVDASRWSAGPTRVRPSPCPPGFPQTWAAARLEGSLRRALTAYKDQERRDLAGPLAALLADTVLAVSGSLPGPREVLARGGVVLLVPVPSSASSRRRRGDRPLDSLVAQLPARLPRGMVPLPALDQRRRVADQAGLDAKGRSANLRDAFTLDPRLVADVRGRHCVVVDDIVTTGATLVEASRVLRAAGAADVVAAVVAATQREGGLVAP